VDVCVCQGSLKKLEVLEFESWKNLENSHIYEKVEVLELLKYKC